MSKKINKYFVAIPVADWQTAKMLGSETNWKILELLREAGIEGMSAQEIAKCAEIPISSVYAVLNELTAADFVESKIRRQAWGRPPKEAKQRSSDRGKPASAYIQEAPWGDSIFDAEFDESMNYVLQHSEKEVTELKEKLLSFLDKAVPMYQADDQLEKFFPQDKIHECGESHEGMEFLNAVTIKAIYEIYKSKEFSELATKYKFKE